MLLRAKTQRELEWGASGYWIADYIYTRVHEGCARLSGGLCTVHDIIVELGARLYDIKGGSVHSTRHRSRLL